MILHLQPNQWSCLPTAFGIILELTPRQMFEAIGHDGSDIVFPDLPSPQNRRSFHIQECVNVCLLNLVFPVCIERYCLIQPWDESIEPYDINMPLERWEAQLALISGVLIGTYKGKPHAVAWNRVEQLCYDPDGMKYPIRDFDPLSFYAMY